VTDERVVVAARHGHELCPYCRETTEASAVICPECRTRYHAVCLDEFGGQCATLGCSAALSHEQGMELAVVDRTRSRKVSRALWIVLLVGGLAWVTFVAVLNGFGDPLNIYYHLGDLDAARVALAQRDWWWSLSGYFFWPPVLLGGSLLLIRWIVRSREEMRPSK
jgi:hypothetical protein